MDITVAHLQAFAERTHREFGVTGVAAVVDEVAVVGERLLRQYVKRVLQRRVAARIVTGVEVGEAIDHAVVGDRIGEQAGDAEVDAATSAEDFVADRAVVRIRIGMRTRELLGDRHADLHRATGLDRIGVGEQRLPERHAIDEVLEDEAELALGPSLEGGRITPEIDSGLDVRSSLCLQGEQLL